jgi:hypothetical protein
VPPRPLSHGACHTSAAVTSLPLSKHSGGGSTIPPFSGWLVYLQFVWGVPFPNSPVDHAKLQLLLQVFCSPSTFGEVAPHPASQAICLFTVHIGSTPPQLSSGASHTLPAVTSLPLSKHTGGGGTTPTFSASLFIYSSMREFPSLTLWSSGCPTLFAMCPLFFSAACLLFRVFFLFFSLVEVSLSRVLC